MVTSRNRKHDRQYFYKYTSAKTAINILTNKKLRLSSPLIFNDPFDIARELRLPDSAKIKNALLIEISRLIKNDANLDGIIIPFIKDFLQTLKLLDKTDILIRFTSYLNSDTIPDIIKIFESSDDFKELNETWKIMLPKTRILSLSEINDNPVMWTHYSNDYEGVVLELECLDIYDSSLLLAEKVNYTAIEPTLGSINFWVKFLTGQIEDDFIDMFNDQLHNFRITKQELWSYEKEWRITSFDFNGDKSSTDYGFHPRTFSKLYFGNKISSEVKSRIINLSKYNLEHLEFYDMEADQDTRKLKFNRI